MHSPQCANSFCGWFKTLTVVIIAFQVQTILVKAHASLIQK